MTAVRPLRLGLMSFAHLHAEGYAGLLGALPGVEYVGFSDDDAERGRAIAARFPGRFVGDHAALLAEGVDGVIVCSENARHLPLIEMTAARGVHVLCEKPLATTPEDAHAALAAAEKGGIGLYTAFPMRFNAPTLETRRFLHAGGLGRVWAANGTNQGECPEHHRAWFTDPALAGGGAVADHTVHLADLLRWICASEPVEVFAETNTVLYPHVGARGVETGGLLSIAFADGLFATLDCSWSKPPYYPTWGGLTLQFVGEKGVVSLDAFRQKLTVYREEAVRPVFAGWASDANAAMLAAFAAALRGETTALATGHDGARAVAVVAAAYESARTGQPARVQA
jgi:predicted dehydrogenase